MYASENDMPSEAVFPIELAEPFTPRKSAANSPAPSSSQPNHTRGKPRNGSNKARPKQQVASPAAAKQGRATPPQTAPHNKPAAAPAFAGATFSASPLPSSLPIPSFLAKALDSPSVRNTDRISREPSPPATDSEAPTPQHRLPSADMAPGQSPLDIFFRADRAEKERARRASSANVVLASNPGPFSPPVQMQSPTEPKTVPSQLSGARNRWSGDSPRVDSYSPLASAGISASELNGTPGRPVGPAFSRPYQDRIRAARRGERQVEPVQETLTPSAQEQQQQQQQQKQQQQQGPVDLSERLKQFLAIGSGQGSGAADGDGHQQQKQQPPPPPPPPLPPYTIAHSPGFADGPLPTTAARTEPFWAATNGSDADATGRSPEILHLEDSLRRMLKIDHGGGSGPGFGAVPPTSYQSS